jgi:hypothetical protein
VGKLHLDLEVADRAQAADDGGRIARSGELDRQAIERVDVDPLVRYVVRLEGGADDLDALLDRQQGRLLRIGQYGDDDRIEHRGGALDDVEVAVRDRVERAWVDRDAHPSSVRR